MAQVDIKKLKKWHAMSEQLKQLRDDEMALRKEIVNEICGDSAKSSAKLSVIGMEIKAKKNTSISVELKGDEFGAAFVLLDDEEKACFKFTPEFRKSEYNKLNKDQKTMVDIFLIEKPAAPELKITFKE